MTTYLLLVNASSPAYPLGIYNAPLRLIDSSCQLQPADHIGIKNPTRDAIECALATDVGLANLFRCIKKKIGIDNFETSPNS